MKRMMKAVRYPDCGNPGVLIFVDAPVPKPEPHEVLVCVYAAGVNPADKQIRAGERFRLEKPFGFIPGFEVTGVVEKRGKLVDEGRFQPNVVRVLPLSEARRAHELIQTGHTRGKIVLQIESQ